MINPFYFYFKNALKNYTKNTIVIDRLWEDIANHYAEESRHYHTIKHLEALTNELIEVKKRLPDWNLVVVAIAYHDIIYNPLKNDNEEKSADHADKLLTGLLDTQGLERCRHMILATKNHELDTAADVNYFIDADLSILGASGDNYLIYTKQIRKEYEFYPDFIYNRGRQKVLKHFLAMNQIYKTDYFFNKYELQARINLNTELEKLFN